MMFLSLVFSVMALGSAVANDANMSLDGKPKKVVINVNVPPVGGCNGVFDLGCPPPPPPHGAHYGCHHHHGPKHGDKHHYNGHKPRGNKRPGGHAHGNHNGGRDGKGHDSRPGGHGGRGGR